MTTPRAETVPRTPADATAPAKPSHGGQRPLTLAEIPASGRWRVATVTGHDPTASRLRELGFVPGTEIAFGRRAPLGDPTIYALRGAHICLRHSEARRIAIEPLPHL
jgi:Fe2+ transport system protein FeoA